MRTSSTKPKQKQKNICFLFLKSLAELTGFHVLFRTICGNNTDCDNMVVSASIFLFIWFVITRFWFWRRVNLPIRFSSDWNSVRPVSFYILFSWHGFGIFFLVVFLLFCVQGNGIKDRKCTLVVMEKFHSLRTWNNKRESHRVCLLHVAADKITLTAYSRETWNADRDFFSFSFSFKKKIKFKRNKTRNRYLFCAFVRTVYGIFIFWTDRRNSMVKTLLHVEAVWRDSLFYFSTFERSRDFAKTCLSAWPPPTCLTFSITFYLHSSSSRFSNCRSTDWIDRKISLPLMRPFNSRRPFWTDW